MPQVPDDNIPTLTNVVCPGETLRAAGLWLPQNQPLVQQTPGENWQARMPKNLEDRSEAILEEVRRRVLQAAERTLDPDRKLPGKKNP